jgi:hypothetical protein
MTGKMWRHIGELIARVNIHLLQLKTQSETFSFWKSVIGKRIALTDPSVALSPD